MSSAISRETMHQFLSNRSSAELEEIVSIAASLQMSRRRGSSNEHRSSHSKVHKTSPASIGSAAAKDRAHNMDASHIVAKRPLNSWMAFRSYYSTMFSSQQQKEISGLLTQLWQADQFKAKWTILAKAYSVIRDQEGKASAPLYNFLQLTCPVIGIIDPAHYLHMLGWHVSDNSGHLQVSRLAIPDPNSFHASLRTSNLSVDDVVSFCYRNGYVSNASANINSPATALQNLEGVKNNLTMATHPKARTPSDAGKPASQNNSSSQQIASNASNGYIEATRRLSPNSASSTVDPAHLQWGYDFSQKLERTPARSLEETPVITKEDLEGIMWVQPDHPAGTTSQTQAASAVTASHIPAGQAAITRNQILFYQANVEFPYNELFHPECDIPFHFDPYEHDPHDAYDVSAFDFATHWDNVDYSQNTPYVCEHMQDYEEEVIDASTGAV